MNNFVHNRAIMSATTAEFFLHAFGYVYPLTGLLRLDSRVDFLMFTEGELTKKNN